MSGPGLHELDPMPFVGLGVYKLWYRSIQMRLQFDFHWITRAIPLIAALSFSAMLTRDTYQKRTLPTCALICYIIPSYSTDITIQNCN